MMKLKTKIDLRDSDEFWVTYSACNSFVLKLRRAIRRILNGND